MKRNSSEKLLAIIILTTVGMLSAGHFYSLKLNEEKWREETQKNISNNQTVSVEFLDIPTLNDMRENNKQAILMNENKDRDKQKELFQLCVNNFNHTIRRMKELSLEGNKSIFLRNLFAFTKENEHGEEYIESIDCDFVNNEKLKEFKNKGYVITSEDFGYTISWE